MHWIATIGEAWLGTLGWLTGLALAFALLGKLMPCNPGMYWWKDLRAFLTDILYWFVVPLFMRAGRVVLLVVAATLLFGGQRPHFWAVGQWPLWVQCAAILLFQDVLLYWIHRLFHHRFVWKFHAIHHSPEVLDWMAAQRFHPVNYLLEFVLADVVVLVLGFSPAALLALAPINVIYSTMVHANLNWTFGPLRYVFASPVFHRWHHTLEEQGLDKNFASTFPFLDLLFGTFHMPAGELPQVFGTGDADFPEGFWGQLFHPFRRNAGAPAWSRRGRIAGWTAVGALGLLGVLAARHYLATPTDARKQPSLEAEPVSVAQVRSEDAASRGGAILSVAVSANGQRLVSGNVDGTIKVWDAASGRAVLTLKGHTRPVDAVAISSDGERLVSGSQDGTVKLWDMATGLEQRSWAAYPSAVFGLAIDNKGKQLVTAGFEKVKVWDMATGQEMLSVTADVGAVLSVAVSADGQHMAAASWSQARVWDMRTGQEKLVLKGHTDLVYSVAFSPDGRRLATSSLDETVKIWDAATGQALHTLKGHKGLVYAVAFSPDGQRVVSGGADGTVKVWEVTTGREVRTLKGQKEAVTSVAVSADGQHIVSSSRDGTVRVWEARGDGSKTFGSVQP